MQFGQKDRKLGTYELEEDAARAYDKVARMLGRSDLNFPNAGGLEIHGQRSEGADTAVAAAVEAARTFVGKKSNESAPGYQVCRGRNTAHGLSIHNAIQKNLMC